MSILNPVFSLEPLPATPYELHEKPEWRMGVAPLQTALPVEPEPVPYVPPPPVGVAPPPPENGAPKYDPDRLPYEQEIPLPGSGDPRTLPVTPPNPADVKAQVSSKATVILLAALAAYLVLYAD